jgi:protein TonB
MCVPPRKPPSSRRPRREDPTPEATPQPPAPDARALPRPRPRPRPKPPPPVPKPRRPRRRPSRRPTKPDNDFFASLEASIAKTKKATGKPTANAPKGPARQETSVSARPAAGAATGLSAAALGRLQGEVQDRWNPNCEVEGGANVNVRWCS